MNTRTLHPTRAGFSMIELMVVLVVVGIAASLATPAMDGYVDRTRTRRALDHLVADLARTRLLAVQEGRPAALRFQTDATYAVQTQETDGTWTTLQTVALRDDFRGVTLQGDVTGLEFSSRGLVTNLTGDAFIRIIANDARDSVFVSPAGRAYRDF